MTTVQTSATVRFSSSGAVKVEPFIRLTAATHIRCHAPTRTARRSWRSMTGTCRLSLTVPDTGHVTGQDVNRAMALADAVARYVAELGEHVADGDSAAQDAA